MPPSSGRACWRALAEGAAVALVTDAGTPLVSDPGFRLVREAIAAGHPRRCRCPAPRRCLAALVVAGLPTDRFLFAGFLPPKAGGRRTRLAELAAVPATLVFFETGPRLADSLADMAAVLGGARPAAVCRELTKLLEKVRRGTLAELAAAYAAAWSPRARSSSWSARRCRRRRRPKPTSTRRWLRRWPARSLKDAAAEVAAATRPAAPRALSAGARTERGA